MSDKPCDYWLHDRTCGSTDRVKVFLTGRRCPAHTPRALRGLPEIVPDPERTLDGLRRKGGIAGSGFLNSSGLVDERALASGKRRGNPAARKAAIAAEDKRRQQQQRRRR